MGLEGGGEAEAGAGGSDQLLLAAVVVAKAFLACTRASRDGSECEEVVSLSDSVAEVATAAAE